MTYEEQTSVEDELNMAIERQSRFKRQITRLEAMLMNEPDEIQDDADEPNETQDTDNIVEPTI